ncbi:hypothetical protein H9Q72_013255 [Fusarium xylarioides]|uniref:Zn(2)-C6 fungal-type domain-containing protein n=1 Tax=Fusarium xylarioides TaxID=221167 RepID=A0A9P7HJE2_9HYPO|nr:hypothetical protein H9Q72_013255 [Fusarium xylarioides]
MHDNSGKKRCSAGGMEVSQRKRTRKVRASIACDVCRVRKVRCSVASDGPPCTNCRLDGIQYTIPLEGRERKKGAIATVIDRNSQAVINVNRATDSENINVNTRCIPVNTSSTLTPQAPANSGPHEQPVSQQPSPPREPEQVMGWRIFEPEKLPGFIIPIAVPLAQSTTDFLSANGAFSFPANKDVRQKLVYGYLRGVHWMYPVFHADKAMLFAAIPFVDNATCQSLGFQSHLEARSSLYQRAKVLYDADIEPGIADIARCLILLSLWSEDGPMRRDSWYWTGCLASVLERAEPWRNTDASSDTAMPIRLWWCCLARDAHVALVVRRPARLYSLHDKIPLQSLQVYATNTEDIIESNERCGNTDVALRLLLTARLATVIAKILQNESAVLPGSPQPNQAIFRACELDLASWSASFISTFPQSGDKQYRLSRETGPFITISLMMHDTAINALYLPRVLRTRSCSPQAEPNVSLYMKRMRRAATRTTVLMGEALISEWAKSIPTQVFTPLLSSIPVHIVGVNSPRAEVAITSLRCLGACLSLLGNLESRFGLALHLKKDIVNTLSRMNVDLTCYMKDINGTEGQFATADSELFEGALNLDPQASSEPLPHPFNGVGDPFDDSSWENAAPGLLEVNSGERGVVDTGPSDIYGLPLVDEALDIATYEQWNGHETALLTADSFNNLPHDLQDWFDDGFVLSS